MRELKDHIVEADLPQNQLTIEVTDEPGAGGANHRYEITGFDTGLNPSRTDKDGYASGFSRMLVIFQNGPIKEAGVNGITQEALLAIVIDRLRSFQEGPFPSDENSIALIHCGVALDALKSRTCNRLARGVEGQTKA
jgi:hypothetical protein